MDYEIKIPRRFLWSIRLTCRIFILDHTVDDFSIENVLYVIKLYMFLYLVYFILAIVCTLYIKFIICINVNVIGFNKVYDCADELINRESVVF